MHGSTPVEFRPSKTAAFVRSFLATLGVALTWTLVDRQLTGEALAYSVAALCVTVAAYSLVDALVLSRFRVIRITDEEILGPGAGIATQVRIPRSAVRAVTRTRRTLTVSAEDQDPIVVRLAEHAPRVDALVRRVQEWAGGENPKGL